MSADITIYNQDKNIVKNIINNISYDTIRELGNVSDVNGKRNIIDMLESRILASSSKIRKKWKSSTTTSQCVLFCDDYVYKIYVKNITLLFESFVRHSLAELYQSYGMDWDIKSFYYDDFFIDIERREYLDVVDPDHDPRKNKFLFTENHQSSWDSSGVIKKSEIKMEDFLPSYKYMVKDLMKTSLFEDILSKIKLKWPEVDSVLLIRDAIPSAIDYAYYKDRVVLLDDGDFSLVFFDKQGNILQNSPWGIHDINIVLNDKKLDFIVHENFKKVNTINHLPDNFYKFSFIYVKENTKFSPNIFDYSLQLANMYNDCINKQIHILLDKNRIDKKILIPSQYANKEKKSFQWELWTECNSKCSFCYLGKENNVFNETRALKSLVDLNKHLDTFDSNTYDTISLIGGEFFQGQLKNEVVRYIFFETIKKIYLLFTSGKINNIWITATLTLGDQKDLYELLDLSKFYKVDACSDKEKGLWICTSWDTKGRFHTDDMLHNWEKHMDKISTDYPFVKKNTTIILSKPFIQDYLDNKFNCKKFQERYKTSLFFKQPGVFSPCTEKECKDIDIEKSWLQQKTDLNKYIGFEFYPQRSEFLNFLSKFKEQDEYLFDKLFNIVYRADALHRNFNNKTTDDLFIRDKESGMQEEPAPFHLKCGHVCNYACYIDSNKCCLCDKGIIESD